MDAGLRDNGGHEEEVVRLGEEGEADGARVEDEDRARVGDLQG